MTFRFYHGFEVSRAIHMYIRGQRMSNVDVLLHILGGFHVYYHVYCVENTVVTRKYLCIVLIEYF